MKLHIDIDCFFVSAHRINNDKLKNIPLAVGGRSNLTIFDTKKHNYGLSNIDGAFTSSILSSNDVSFKEYFMDGERVRGIITTSSYEAREYGVKTAMSIAEALKHCPKLTVLPPDYKLYHKLSKELKDLLALEIPHIEQFSIDEFFGDISGWVDSKDAMLFALKLQEKINNELKLPVSIGIAHSKWIAKLATEYAKPYGVYIVKSEEVDDFIKEIPIHKFPGIGSGYKKRLEAKGIKTLGEIKKHKNLFYSWKKPGIQLYNRILGTDNEPMKQPKPKKSIGIGRTFDALYDRSEVKRRIIILSRHLCFLALKNNHSPTSYYIKIRYESKARYKTHQNSNRLFNEQLIKQIMVEMFNTIDTHPRHGIIQLNLMVYNFLEHKPITPNIIHHKEDAKHAKVTKSLQSIRNKYGIDIVKTGNEKF